MYAGGVHRASASSPSPLRQGPFLAGLFLTTAASLALEVLTTRLLSVVTWYSLAYLVVGMGLLGLTVGALRVYFRPERWSEAVLADSLARETLYFAWAIPLSYCVLIILPLRTPPAATTVVLFAAFAGAIALPFVPAGSVIAAALTRTRFPVGRVYAVDLLGAALGAPAVPLLLHGLNAGSAILLAAAVAAVAAAVFASAGTRGPWTRRGVLSACVLVAVAGLNSLGHSGLVPVWAKEAPEHPEWVEEEYWNSHSRVQVFKEIEAPAMMWGPGSKCPPPMVSQRNVVIDAHAATPLYRAKNGNLQSLGFLACDVTDTVNALRPTGPIAIIGVGGSRDLQAALLSGHEPILGIELNDRILGILQGPLGAPTLVPDDPRVRLVHDEARSYLSRTDERFEVIQASLIDTWAATGAGAHALSENGLYTMEAWNTFLDHLEPNGIFSVSRWVTIETSRLVSLAMGTLLSRGAANPAEHIALLQGGLVTTMLVGREPLTERDRERLRKAADHRGFSLLVLPGMPPPPEMAPMLSATSLAELDQRTLSPVLDLQPPTDNQPFFFNAIRLAAFWKEAAPGTALTLEGNLVATRTLAIAFFVSLLFVGLAIIMPLWKRARPSGHVDVQLTAGLAYFLLIGVGFMLAEIALLQRMSLILGHPVYSLVVVLSSLVASAGIGSLISDRLPLDRAPWCYVYPLVLAAALVAIALVWPALGPRVMPESTPVRVAFSVVVMGAVGLFLGTAFPAGMRLVQGRHDAETPWFWGMNGIGSVLASSLAIALAVSEGITLVLLIAAGCYVLLLPVIALVRRA